MLFRHCLPIGLGLCALHAIAQEPTTDAAIEPFSPNPYADEALVPPPPPVQMTNLQFRGVTAFPEDDLKAVIAEQLGGIAEGGLTPAAADDTAFFLAIYYRKFGYSQVEVTEEITASGELVLNVKEGPLTHVAETNFVGNEYIDDETLRGYLLGATMERLSTSEEELPFIEGDILTGAERIRGYYLAEGFLDSEVSKPEVELSPDGTRAAITIQMVEGTRYLVGQAEIEGDLVFRTTNPNSELDQLLAKYKGQPFTPTQLQNMRRAVVYFYKQRGYYKVEVDAEADPALAVEGVVPIRLIVESGALYRFDGITTKGVKRLRESFLQKRFGQLTGQIYDPEKVNEVFREMMRTGLFSRLQVNQKAVENNEVRLSLVVQEAKSKELGFSLGYGTFEGAFVGFSAGERNLLGTGRSISGGVQASQRYYDGEIVFHDRWFLESKFDFRARLNALTTRYDGYTKFEIGAQGVLSRQLTEHLNVNAFLQGRHVTVTGTGIDPAYLGPTDYIVTTPGVSASLDYRDSPLNPRQGWIASTSLEFASSALGSDVDYLRSTYRFSYYLPVLKKGLLAFGARGGLLVTGSEPLGLPIDERFFNGGSRSVRSFAERELGPRDGNDFPVGGQSFTTYNIEFVYPIVGGLQGAVFVDAGSVGAESLDGISDLRYGIGAGLRYALPIGPLRLDYGVNPSPREGEAFGAFHFSFGFAF